ncbi:FAD-binding oxidoreductase [Desulfovibrio sp. JC022]|nr:FAD-binding oxidoreductase [Desulfovibrio sp. JC022]
MNCRNYGKESAVQTADVLVIGGGITGSTTALGLMLKGAGKVVLLDEQLKSQRLSRGNFGLTWFMCKGAGYPGYSLWCRKAAKAWPEFAEKLEGESKYNIELDWTGGAVHAFGQDELDGFAKSIKTIREGCESEGIDYPVEILDRQQFADLMPKMTLGEDVAGAMFTKEQGHVNPLKLLGAVRSWFQKLGGVYNGAEGAKEIIPQSNGTVLVKTATETYECKKLVIAAGHGSARLTAALGEKLNIYPQRGQLMVTARCERKLDFPLLSVRQTQDGTYMIGLSTENTALDARVTADAMKSQAANAVRIFPELANLNWVRAWGAIRVMTPDGGPIYSKIPGHDNISVLALHSGVSLAPLHTEVIAPWILGNTTDNQVSDFSNGRFNA